MDMDMRKTLLLMFALSFFLAVPAYAYPSWQNASFDWRECRNVSHSGTQTLYNFTINFTIDTYSLDNAGKLDSEGKNIRFYSGDGKQLKWEFDDYKWGFNNASRETTMWVMLPEFTTTEKTVCMYYDNNAGFGWGNNSKGEMWNSTLYYAVYHFTPNATIVAGKNYVLDSSGHAKHLKCNWTHDGGGFGGSILNMTHGLFLNGKWGFGLNTSADARGGLDNLTMVCRSVPNATFDCPTPNDLAVRSWVNYTSPVVGVWDNYGVCGTATAPPTSDVVHIVDVFTLHRQHCFDNSVQYFGNTSFSVAAGELTQRWRASGGYANVTMNIWNIWGGRYGYSTGTREWLLNGEVKRSRTGTRYYDCSTSPRHLQIGDNITGTIDELRMSYAWVPDDWLAAEYSFTAENFAEESQSSGGGSNATCEYQIDSNTIALYHFNTGSGTTAKDETNVYNMSFKASGEPVWTVTSRCGNYALNFDGVNDYIYSPASELFGTTFPTNGSIEFWMRPSKTYDNTYADYVYFIHKKMQQGHQIILSFRGSTDPDKGKICFHKTTEGDTQKVCTTTDTWTQDKWYHLSIEWGKKGMKIYVNGTLEGSNTNTDKPSAGSSENFMVAIDPSFSVPSFDGIIDELRISDIQRGPNAFIFENISISPASGQTYPLNFAEFNTSVKNIGLGTISGVFIEHNFTGTKQNYTMFKIGNVYTYNYSNFSAVNGAFRFWTNNTFNIKNFTEWKPYIVKRKASGLSLSISPTWRVAQSDIIYISCTNTVGLNATLKKDGVAIQNPYNDMMLSGQYNISCELSDTQNYTPAVLWNTLYVELDSFDCTNRTIYAFRKNLTGISGNNLTLDFTSLVSNYIVKSNLSDVWVPRNAWKNTTNGYYLTVNITGLNSIEVKFGNYIANNTYPEAHLSANKTTVTTENTETMSYYFITFKDEFSGLKTLPPNATSIKLTMTCEEGQTEININDTTIILPTFSSKADSLIAKVSYTSDYYIRERLVDSDIESVIIYLVDAFKRSVLQIPIKIEDFQFFNSEIEIYKSIKSQASIMTEGYFGIENQYVAYLVKDESYFLRLKKGSVVREVGAYRPSSATELTLSLNTISLKPDITYVSDKIQIAAENTTMDTLRITYNDKLNKTNWVRIRVFEGTSKTALYDTNFTGSNQINITVTSLNMSKYYTVMFTIGHQYFGNSPVEDAVFVGKRYKSFGFGAIPNFIYGAIGFIMMMFTAFAITPQNRFVGLLVITGVLVLLITVTWLEFAAYLLALLVVFIAVSFVYEIKKGGYK